MKTWQKVVIVVATGVVIGAVVWYYYPSIRNWFSKTLQLDGTVQ